MKRGNFKAQVTLFVIIGILIVAAAGGYVYYNKIENDKRLSNEFFSQESIKLLFDNLQSNIITCVDDVGREGLKIIGKQGGYYKKPLKYLDLNQSFVPYYYYGGDILMPNNEGISRELEGYINNNFGYCLDNLKSSGFELEYSTPISSVVINKDNVLFNVNSSIIIRKEGRSIVFYTNDYPISQNSALSDILDVARYITDSHKLNSKMYCLSCVDKTAEEKNVYVWTNSISENTVQIVIGENRTSYEPYLFNFLNKYVGNEVSDDYLLNENLIEGLPGGIVNGK